MSKKMDLITKLKAYANGFADVPKHAFDFSDEDIDILLASLELVKCLAKKDFPHNFQRERNDIAEYCYGMTAIQGAAKELSKKIFNI